MKTRLFFLYLAAALCLSSCLGHTPLRWDESKDSHPLLRAQWSKKLYPTENFAFQPVDTATPLIVGSVAYMGGKDGVLRALRVQDGQALWTVELGEAIQAQPIKSDADLFVGAMDGFLYRMSRENGTTRWSYDTSSAIVSSPAVSGGRVFVINNKNDLVALDAVTGKFLWHKQRSHRTEFTMHGQAPPLVSDGLLYVGFSDGTLSCLEPEDGATVWTRKLGEGDIRFADVDEVLVLDQGLLFAASFNGGLYALDALSGETVWRVRLNGAATAVGTGGFLYVTTADNEVLGLRVETGATLWRTRLAEVKGPLTPPVKVGPWLLVSTGSNLVALRASSGVVVGSWRAGSGFSALPVVDGNRVFNLSNGGLLYRFALQGEGP